MFMSSQWLSQKIAKDGCDHWSVIIHPLFLWSSNVSMSKEGFHPYNCIISGDGWNLSLLLLIDSWHQTSDAVLELAVLGGVDERVDAAVGERQDHGEVIEPRDDREFYAT